MIKAQTSMSLDHSFDPPSEKDDYCQTDIWSKTHTCTHTHHAQVLAYEKKNSNHKVNVRDSFSCI